MNALKFAAFAAILTLCSARLEAQTTTSFTSSKDNTLFESITGSLSNGVGTNLFVGRTDNSELRRGLVQFDLSTLPTTATVTSVTFSFRVTQTATGNEPVALHRVTASWGEGTSNSTGGGGGGGAAATTNDATWIHRFSNTSNWTSAGGDFVTAPSATISVGGSATYTVPSSANLIADVQGWISNPSANFGWILIGNETLDQTAKRIATREATTAANRPTLSVTYTSTVLASVTSSGTSCPNPGGSTLTLSATGVPSFGNTNFSLTLSGGVPGNPAYLFHSVGLGVSPTTFQGCPVYLDIPSLFAIAATGASPIGPFNLGVTGSLTLVASVANVPSLVGQRLDVQGIAISNLMMGTTTTSNALTLILGN